jgi:HSP20 family protein
MTLVKFNNKPVKNFDSFFDDFFTNLPFNTPALAGNASKVPAVNIHETKDAYHLELNAPGRQKEDFTINVDKGLLTIGYEKKQETKSEDYKTVRREFSFETFKRTFSVDEKIDVDNIQAKYENGLLKLHLPKKEDHKQETKQITVQ